MDVTTKPLIFDADNGGQIEHLPNVIRKLERAGVSAIIMEDKIDGFFDEITKETYKQMRQHSDEKVPVEVILFDFDGKVLSKYEKE